MEDTNRKFARGMRAVALGTFLIGTALLTAYYFIGDKVLMVGYTYLVVALFVDVPFALIGLSDAIRYRDRTLLLSVGMLLLNIPAMLFYVWFAFMLMDTARITFSNSTESELTGIQLSGCSNYVIEPLQPGEEETVWVRIPHDCSLDLLYVIDGDTVEENVCGYLTNGMGAAMDYRIGGQNDSDEYVR